MAGSAPDPSHQESNVSLEGNLRREQSFVWRDGDSSHTDIVSKLLSIRGKDYEALNIVEVSSDLWFKKRANMNRLTFLAVCRRNINLSSPKKGPETAPHPPAMLLKPQPVDNKKQPGGSKAHAHALPEKGKARATLPRSTSPDTRDRERKALPGGPFRNKGTLTRPTLIGKSRHCMHLADKTDQRPAGMLSYSQDAPESLGLPLQLRDIRCVQSISEPVLFVRRGAIIISFGPFRSIITRTACFLLQPSDSVLHSLLGKLKDIFNDVKLPFELSVLESMLVLAIESYAVLVETTSQMMTALAKDLRKNITTALLNEAYALKGRVGRALLQMAGARDALERIQKDGNAKNLMLSSGNLGDEDKRHESDVELLLDAYELEVESLQTRMSLIGKEIQNLEDVLNLRLENIQKNTFVANAFFRMVVAILGVPTVVAGWWGTNFWSGMKFDLAGPGFGGLNYTFPDFPVDEYSEDPSLPVSWVFLFNSVGLAVICVLLCGAMACYVRWQGLTHFRA